MQVTEAVEKVASKFKYTSDKKLRLGDAWFVMHERDGYLRGDCDDFSLTTIWEICDRSVLKFIWFVVITHQYQMWYCTSGNGNPHIVGYARGLWFDNWSKQALTKHEFLESTKHKLRFPYPSPTILIFMLIGAFKQH